MGNIPEGRRGSLGTAYPHLLDEWDYVLNQGTDPFSIAAQSNTKRFWRCALGHSWQAAVYSRTRGGKGCPYCAGRKVLAGFNDLATTHPDLVAEWDDERDITTVSAGSRYVALWRCTRKESHSYPAVVERRVKGQQCSYCSGRRVLAGFNDLTTTHPDIAAEYADERDMSTLSAGSHYRAYWECSCGQRYQATVYHRTSGRGCPYCAGKKTAVGTTDLASTHPDLAEEWDDERDITTVSSGSDYRAQWRCRHGHRWNATVANRANTGHKCPYCTGRSVLPGFNDLATTHPELCSEWSSSNEKTLLEVSAGSTYKATWVCSDGHTWVSTVYDRAGSRKQGCPQCWSETFSSCAETTIREHIEATIPGVDMVSTSRRIIPPKELDIYVPEKNLAVEYNGLYWHSEARGKGKWAHVDKWKQCRQQGIQLLTIWEDDYVDDPALVKRRIQNYLEDEDSTHRIDEISLHRVPSDKASSFREKHSLLSEGHWVQAFEDTVDIGVSATDGELIAVMTWTFGDDEATMIHYAEKEGRRILFAGTLQRAMQDPLLAGGCSRIAVIDDNEMPDERKLERLGFEKTELLDPSFCYLYQKKRMPENRIPDDENVAQDIRSRPKIWDSGRTLWSLTRAQDT